MITMMGGEREREREREREILNMLCIEKYIL